MRYVYRGCFFVFCFVFFFFFQAEDGIRDAQESRGLVSATRLKGIVQSAKEIKMFLVQMSF